ncbi:hypothetical protein SAMN04488128_103214 [Chitinophaga eiseniae]|uniref:Uncharacterized protein n=1 Tax=Chitinophaga eiseniae TaxID=634771 RepID=A0A1T4SPG3_9BACT|nr:hypothetical protein [Chitinophaga eiseniae]SKA30057.1 hypothetical protein SAMN04488128_103214 [Chitinophaga eiseniae]
MARTVTITTDVDVDLDEIETYQLIEELGRRMEKRMDKSYSRSSDYITRDEVSELYNMSCRTLGAKSRFTGSLLDQLKFEVFEEAKDRFTLEGLQKALSK